MAWLNRIRNTLSRRSLRRDLDRELAFHIQEREDELHASGLTAAEASRLARLQFGSPVNHLEETMEADINIYMDAAVRNLRLAARNMVNAPVFSITVILTLAAGIGGSSAVYSAIDAVLLRPLPFPDSEQLVLVSQVDRNDPSPFVAPIRLKEWNALNSAFDGITGSYEESASETSGEYPERLRIAFTAPDFLRVLRVSPVIGRDFNEIEQTFNGPPAVLISDRLWRRRFNGTQDAIGKSLQLGRQSYPIVGIMPPRFQFPSRDTDVWRPSPADAPFAQGRKLTWFRAVGRLKPQFSRQQAEENLASVQASLTRQFPDPDAGISVALRSMRESSTGDSRQSLWLSFGAVSVLLLLACANVGALLLSRANSCRQEIAVRFSLGATRTTVIAQWLTEVFLLALAGAAAGLGLAWLAVHRFQTLAKDLPRFDEITLDWHTVAFALGCVVVTTLLCGLYPAVQATRRDLTVALNRGGRAGIGGANHAQLTLVGVQMALAVTLLVGAALLLRSFQELGRVEAGFESAKILTFQLSTSWAETGDRAGSARRMQTILDALTAIPLAVSAASMAALPGLPVGQPVQFEPRETGGLDPSRKIVAGVRYVTPSYFKTFDIPRLAGETCAESATVSTMMVNRAFADTYFAGQTIIGRHLTIAGNPFVPPSEVRGVTADARESGLDQPPLPIVYLCGAPLQPGSYFAVRTAGSPMAIAAAVRQRLRELEPLRSVYDVSPLEDRIASSYSQQKLRTGLISLFALAAIALAAIGLYGTLSYLVQVRRKEVGVRLAIGAMRWQIVRQFLLQGLHVAALGAVAGIALATAGSRILAGVLYGVTASDPLALGGVLALVLSVSGIASLLPALNASRLDPVRALRDE